MDRSEIRKRTKMLAKGVAAQSIFKLIFVIAVQFVTAFALSSLIVELAVRFFPTAVIYFGPYSLHYVGVLLSLAAGLLIVPLELGVTEYILKLVRRQEAKLVDVFNWYSEPSKLRAGLSYFWFSAALAAIGIPLVRLPLDYLYTVLGDVNAALMKQASEGVAFAVEINAPMAYISLCLLAVGFMVEVRFLAARFVMVDDPKKSGFDAALQSWKHMRGHTWEYIVLILSFALWYVACAATAFIVALYFIPYFTVTQAIFTEYIRSDTALAAAKEPPREGGTGDDG